MNKMLTLSKDDEHLISVCINREGVEDITLNFTYKELNIINFIKTNELRLIRSYWNDERPKSHEESIIATTWRRKELLVGVKLDT